MAYKAVLYTEGDKTLSVVTHNGTIAILAPWKLELPLHFTYHFCTQHTQQF